MITLTYEINVWKKKVIAFKENYYLNVSIDSNQDKPKQLWRNKKHSYQVVKQRCLRLILNRELTDQMELAFNNYCD